MRTPQATSAQFRIFMNPASRPQTGFCLGCKPLFRLLTTMVYREKSGLQTSSQACGNSNRSSSSSCATFTLSILRYGLDCLTWKAARLVTRKLIGTPAEDFSGLASIKRQLLAHTGDKQRIYPRRVDCLVERQHRRGHAARLTAAKNRFPARRAELAVHSRDNGRFVFVGLRQVAGVCHQLRAPTD